MGSRHMVSSPTVLSTIRPTTSNATGGAGEPPDWTLLLGFAERVLGIWDGVGDRLQREVDAFTQHRGVLWLHGAERAGGVRAEVGAGTHLYPYPVQFAGRFYGTLVVAPDPHDPVAPALSEAQALHLARVCGVVLCLLEQGAVLAVLARHLTPEPPEPLTRRQREVLALIARGLSDDEIADGLHIAPDTLRRHRCDLRTRLGVHADRDLLLAAYRCGLVSYVVADA